MLCSAMASPAPVLTDAQLTSSSPCLLLNVNASSHLLRASSNKSIPENTHTKTHFETKHQKTIITRNSNLTLPLFQCIYYAIHSTYDKQQGDVASLSLPIRYRFSGVVTGALTTLQLSASPTRSQQVDSFAQVLLLDEFMLLTCKHAAEEHSSLSSSGSSISSQTQCRSIPSVLTFSIHVGQHNVCATSEYLLV